MLGALRPLLGWTRLEDVQPDDLVVAVAEHRAHVGVGEDHPVHRVEHEDAVSRLLDDLPEPSRTNSRRVRSRAATPRLRRVVSAGVDCTITVGSTLSTASD
jgi:hypothetical protein